MENASKALLIAGAILLAILIISLGLLAFRGANDAVTKNNMDAAEIEAFNMKWERFRGTSVSATNVNALISSAISHNQSEFSNGTNRFITVYVDQNEDYAATQEDQTYGPDGDNPANAGALNATNVQILPSGTNYTVNIEDRDGDDGYSASGLIRNFHIIANSN